MGNLSLRSKIFLLTIVSLLATGMISFIFILINFSDQEDLIKSKLFLTAEVLSNSIQDQFYERYVDVKAFSLHFKNININSRENVNYLNQIIKLHNFYNLIIVCDLNGKLLSVNNESSDGKKINSEILYKLNFSKEKWFRETMENKYLDDAKKNFTKVNFQDANFNEMLEFVYKEKIYATVFSTFIYNSIGKPVGIISAHANFKWIEDIFVRIYEDYLKTGQSSILLTMLNKNGEIILDYDPFYHDGKKEVIHDRETLNKINLVKSGQAAALKLAQGEEGVSEAVNSRSKITQLSANKLVVGNKIVDSLGWKVLFRISKKETSKEKIIFIILFLIIIFIFTMTSFFFSKILAKNLMDMAKRLFRGNEKLNKTSAGALLDSQLLSSSAMEQAAALQKTVTAVNEISAMMNKTSEMASFSRNKFDENKIKINEGKNIVEKMLKSTLNIKKNNEDIMFQVLEGNKRVSEIVKVIAEIESKTRVINEIVFQTKLLSFNASVEAARAGEHGRGFSVVAEEVGNLAQMSGNASKEISFMLENSIDKVKNIIEETKNNVGNILSISKKAVLDGEEITKECASIFQEIFQNTEEINHLVYEIANSAQEQAKGVNEINHAMHELDSVTHQNANIGRKSSQTAEELLKQSQEIEQMASHLLRVIVGEKKQLDIHKIQSNSDDHHSGPPKKDPLKNSREEKFAKLKFEDKKMEKFKSDSKKTIEESLKKSPSTKPLKPGSTKEEEIPSYDDPRFEDL